MPLLPSVQVSLSLEEKAKLAKEQEQQQRFKSQSSLQPQTLNPTNKTTPVKDLTSTLLNANLMTSQSPGMGSSSVASKSSFTSSSGMSTGFGMSSSSPHSKPMNSSTSNVGLGANTSIGLMSGMSQPSQNMSNSGFSASKTNTSSFDDLLMNNSKPKMSLNQMGQAKQISQAGNQQQSLFGMNQGGFSGGGSVGNTGFSSSTNMGQRPVGGGSMMPSQGSAPYGQRMMGNPGMIGNQAMTGGQSMIGGQSMMGNMTQFGNQKPTTGQNQQDNSKTLSTSEIDALLS